MLLLGAAVLLASATAATAPTAAPPGWHAALTPTHHAAIARMTATMPAPCPNEAWAAAASEAGLLSVKLFGAVGNGTADDSHALRAAINASKMCGGCVFLPPGVYHLATTVHIGGSCIIGSASPGAGTDGTSKPQSAISGPSELGHPAIAINGHDTTLQDVTVTGTSIAIYIADVSAPVSSLLSFSGPFVRIPMRGRTVCILGMLHC